MRVLIRTISTWEILLNLERRASRISSASRNGSPPERITSRIEGVFSINSKPSSKRVIEMDFVETDVSACRNGRRLRRMRNNKTTRSGYRWISPGTGLSLLSLRGSVEKSILFQFPDIRYTLSPDRIPCLPDEAQVVGGNPHGITVHNRFQGLYINRVMGRKFLQRGDTLRKISLPFFHSVTD